MSGGQRWIVTGASRGLGKAIADTALDAGARVACLSRSAGRGQESEPDERLIHVAADVTDPKSMAEAAAQIERAWGGIDVLVNNAGLHRGGLVEQLDLGDFADVIATNVSGPLHAVRAFLPLFPAEGEQSEGGSIVNIGAVVGLRGFAGDVAYGSSKAALAGMTRVLAMELARRLIRVNLVLPGFVSTEMTAEISQKARERIIADIPLRREGTPEEIAQVVWWVANAQYMTGSTVATDGGLLCKL